MDKLATYYRHKSPTYGMSGLRRRHLLEIIGRVHKLHILDVGCATGYFGSILKHQDNQVTGIDISSSAITIAKKVLDQAFCINLETKKIPGRERFDLIICSEVIEHLFDPQAVIKKLLTRLKPKGRLIITTPNISFWRNRLTFLLGHFAYTNQGMFDESHIHFFNYPTLKQLLKDCGLILDEENHLTMPYTLKNMLKIRPNLFAYQLIISAQQAAPSPHYQRRWANIALAVFIATITLLGAEVPIKTFFPQATLDSVKHNQPHCYQQSPYLPFTLRSHCHAHHSSPEFSVDLNINAQGFRGHEISFIKPANSLRIVIVGDSMTFGHGVNDDQTFSAVLEKNLRLRFPTKTIEVINAGFASGFSPDSYYLFLKHKLLELQPDIVVETLFVFNDITDLQNTTWNTTAAGLPNKISDTYRVVDHDGYLLPKNSPWYYQLPVVRNSQVGILLGKSIQKIIKKIVPQPVNPDTSPKTALDYYLCLFTNQCFPEMDQYFATTLNLIDASRAITAAGKAQFVLLIIPADVQVDDQAWKKYGAGRFGLSTPPYPQTRLTAIARQAKLPTIDLLPLFIAHKQEKLFFAQDGHFTPQGHTLAAQEIAKFLQQATWVK